eukprot:4748452-Pleurochrysis_carterae.AAC.3
MAQHYREAECRCYEVEFGDRVKHTMHRAGVGAGQGRRASETFDARWGRARSLTLLRRRVRLVQ